MRDSDVHIQVLDTEVQLNDTELFLRTEKQNRVIDKSKELSLFEGLGQAITSSLEILRRPGNVRTVSIDRFKNQDNI